MCCVYGCSTGAAWPGAAQLQCGCCPGAAQLLHGRCAGAWQMLRTYAAGVLRSYCTATARALHGCLADAARICCGGAAQAMLVPMGSLLPSHSCHADWGAPQTRLCPLHVANAQAQGHRHTSVPTAVAPSRMCIPSCIPPPPATTRHQH